MQIHFFEVACLVSCLFMITSIAHGRDTLQVGEILRDWNVLESSGNKFQLTFFGSSFSSYNYLGIKTMGVYDGSGIIWVANRENPLLDHSGFLNLTSNGTLMINSTAGLRPFIVNPGQKSVTSSGNFSLTLLDSGNLVLREGQTILWQSFDFPVDTWLKDMKIGLFGLKTGQPRQQVLVSWLTPFVPYSGAFTLGVDPNNTKQLVIWQRGVVYWRSGNWDGQYFPRLIYHNTFKHFSNENDSFFTLSLEQGQVNTWITLNSSGAMDSTTEVQENGWSLKTFSCEDNSGDWGDGCVNATSQSNCSLGHEFVQTTNFSGVFDYTNYSSSIGINDCREICTKNCSCLAYASLNLKGTGCMFTGNISSLRSGFVSKSAYVRQNVAIPQKDKEKKGLLIFITVPVAFLILVIILISLCYWRRRVFCLGEKDDTRYFREDQDKVDMEEFNSKKDNELPFFSFAAIKSATDDFSIENKLGQGGFGPVYKGKLENGQEIAVKRLARNSDQGTKEFQNEVILISKLQHRNLVRLHGCCIKGEEKLLIYEYMQNNSLDSFIFNATKGVLLDWNQRFCIMEGIAQELLYLHKHSRLRIIHRYLKTSNILLDSDLTPKISDFGTARIFGDKESRANTSTIVGTYGYMSPEYAMDGLFSVKSDVFSYGVMMLGIISGKKNTGFYHDDRFMNLLGYAWNLWKAGKCLEMKDGQLEETSSTTNEVIRCVEIALLCVQENAVDRPNMSDVLSMLTTETIALPIPKQPAFFLTESAKDGVSVESAARYSVTKVPVSDVTGR